MRGGIGKICLLCAIFLELIVGTPALAEVYDAERLLPSNNPFNGEGISFYSEPWKELGGYSANYLGDINDDGIPDMGACGSKPPSPSICYIIYGQPNTSDYVTDVSTFKDMTGAKGSQIKADLGWGHYCTDIRGGGDINGDGIDDFLVQCHGGFGEDIHDPTPFRLYQGTVSVFFGKKKSEAPILPGLFDTSLFWPQSGGNNSGFTIVGDVNIGTVEEGLTQDEYVIGNHFSSIAIIDDVNGDSINEILIGGYANSFLIYGKNKFNNDSFPQIFHLKDLAQRNGNDGSLGKIIVRPSADQTLYQGGSSGNSGGTAAEIGDINNDGVTDFAFSHGLETDVGSKLANVYVLFGPLENSSEIKLEDLIDSDFEQGSKGFAIIPKNFNIYLPLHLGNDVLSAGDVNNDGIDDFIILEANNNLNPIPNTHYLLFGKDYSEGNSFGSKYEIINLYEDMGGNGSEGVVIHSNWSNNIGGGGDFDKDGIDDLCVADWASGVISIIYGRNGLLFPAEIRTLTARNQNEWQDDYQVLTIFGSSSESYVGENCSLAEDLNNDGYFDLLMSGGFATTSVEDTTVSNEGRLYVMYGKNRANIAPIAQIDGSSEITSGDSVNYSSENSYDQNDSITSFEWNSDVLEIVSVLGDTLSFIAMDVDEETVATLSLTVTDEFGLTDTTSIDVTISPKAVVVTPPANTQPPESSESGGGSINIWAIFMLLITIRAAGNRRRK